MILFILAAGVMIAFALALLLPAAWRVSDNTSVDQRAVNVDIAREQLKALQALFDSGGLTVTEFDARREELELNLASSLVEADPADEQHPNLVLTGSSSGKGRWMTWVIALSLPLMATGIYLKTGHVSSLDPDYVASQSPALAVNEKLPPIDELLPRLESHLADNPDDLTGWRLLGVTYLRLRRFADADMALTKAVELDATDADLLFQLADAKAMAAGGSLVGEPLQLIEKAIAIDPTDLRGFWLQGMAKQQSGDFAAAVSTWEELIPLLKDQPEALAEINQLIAGAKDAADGSATVAPPAATGVTPASLSIKVSLDQALAARVTDDQLLFIYAKAVKGPPMPLAVTRLKVEDLPVSLVLDDSMAMVPTMKLSSFDEVVVGARISKTGNPVAQSGDFFVEVSPVSVGQKAAVALTISDIVP